MISPKRSLFCLAPLLLLSLSLQAEQPLFDPEAARMMAASDSLAHGDRAAVSHPVDNHSTESHSADSRPVPHHESHEARASEPSPAETRPAPESKPREFFHFGSYDPRMIEAAHIARRHAEPKMTWLCWRYVKDALVEAGLVQSRPTSIYAKQAGAELVQAHGFIRLHTKDPLNAPVGAVIVYGGKDAGHVEIRTENGFVSDFVSRTPYPRPCLGVFVKPALSASL